MSFTFYSRTPFTRDNNKFKIHGNKIENQKKKKKPRKPKKTQPGLMNKNKPRPTLNSDDLQKILGKPLKDETTGLNAL